MSSKPLLVAAALLLPALVSISGCTRPSYHAGETFRDCLDCPEMVVVPPGSFVMGSTDAETSREDMPKQLAVMERPAHVVTIPRAFAVSKVAVTRAEFNTFALATHFHGSGCWETNLQAEVKVSARGHETDWGNPGFPQTSLKQPVVCVSWNDAHRYVAWLSAKTGRTYRLLTEAEWEYAARAGTTTARYWGDDIGVDNANCGDCDSPWDDTQTAPGGSFKPNAFGLHDMLGNVWQWVEDCANPGYQGAPVNGAAWTKAGCKSHLFRGGSWSARPLGVRAAVRNGNDADARSNDVGIRVARNLP